MILNIYGIQLNEITRKLYPIKAGKIKPIEKKTKYILFEDHKGCCDILQAYWVVVKISY